MSCKFSDDKMILRLTKILNFNFATTLLFGTFATHATKDKLGCFGYWCFVGMRYTLCFVAAFYEQPSVVWYQYY